MPPKKRTRERTEAAEPASPAAKNDSETRIVAAPKLHHCFVAGDLVEAMYQDGCWVPSRVLEVKPRQVLVEYEKEDSSLSAPQIVGPRHSISTDDETPRDVARKTGVPLQIILALNTEKYPGLVANSRLRERTTLALPELHVCKDGDTPKAIAKRFGRDLNLILEKNASSIHGLAGGSKLLLELL